MDNSAALASLYIAQIQVYGTMQSIIMQLSLFQLFSRPRGRSLELCGAPRFVGPICPSASCFSALYGGGRGTWGRGLV